MTIAIIDYGAGNLKSISNSLTKIGAETTIVSDPKQLIDAAAIVLPGVGSYGEAMQRIDGFTQEIHDEINYGKPFLGVCLGIQLLFQSSMESPDIEGLSIFRGTNQKFTNELKVPHMGWNNLVEIKDCPLLEGVKEDDYFYFVHSFYPFPLDEKITAAKTDYGIRFTSVVSDDNVFATQFHPEKSGPAGLKVLENFLRYVKR